MKYSIFILPLILALSFGAAPVRAMDNVPMLENLSLADMGFSQDEVVDLLNIAFAKDDLFGKLFARIKDGEIQTIVLIGESHDQREETRDRALRLVRRYEKIGLEGTHVDSFFHWDLPHVLYIYKNSINLSGPQEYPHSLLSSARLLDRAVVFNLEAGYDLKPALSGLPLLVAAFAVCFLYASGSGLAAEAAILGAIISLVKAATLAFNFNAFVRDTDFNINRELHSRDKCMAVNLINALDSPGSRRVIGAVGSAHLWGLSQFLMHEGFHDCKAQLLEEYIRYRRNPRTAALVSETDPWHLRHEDAGSRCTCHEFCPLERLQRKN